MFRCLAAMLLSAAPVLADAPVVRMASALPSHGRWTVTVTMAHEDSGWDHFASGFAVLLPDGSQLGYRELSHPRIGEDEFTVSLAGLAIPDDVAFVLIRTRCSLVGWSAEPVRLDLQR